MKVEIYSDIACPWCYIGKRRFEQALAGFPGPGRTSRWSTGPTSSSRTPPGRRPRTAPGSPSATGRSRSRWTPGSPSSAAAEGITYDFDTALHVNTLLGHRLLHLALDRVRRRGAGRAQGAAAEGPLQRRVDIGDRAQLTEIAVAAGLGPRPGAEYLAGEEGADEVRAELAEARELGISAVPTFVFEGRWAVQGGQEADTFRGSWSRSPRRPRPRCGRRPRPVPARTIRRGRLLCGRRLRGLIRRHAARCPGPGSRQAGRLSRS